MSSFYLRNFSLIPYPNLQGTFWFVLNLALITYQYRYKTSVLQQVMVGMVMGLNIYFYYGAAFPIFLGAYTICLLRAPNSRLSLRIIFTWALCAGILLVPAVLEKTMLTNMLNRTAPDGPLTSEEIATNIGRAFSAIWISNRESHFVVGSFLDSLSGIFALVGLLWLCAQGVQGWGASRSLVLLWASVTIGIGGLNGYSNGLAITRSHFLLIPAFAIASQGIYVLVETIRLSALRYTARR